jgi:PAS domain S-box-containing protein
MLNLRENLSPSNIRILLVEDGPCSLSRIRDLLSESDLSGFHLDYVTTLMAAAARFRSDVYDVCIIDSVEGKASDFLAQASQVGRLVPSIVLTSMSGEAVLKAFHAGAADCLFREQVDSSTLELSICRVIQETKINSARLEDELRYLALIDNAKDVIYTHDLNGNFKFASRAVEDLTGYTREEILQLNAKQIVAEECLHVTREMVGRLLDEQRERSYELELVRKDGLHVRVEVNAHLVYRAGIPVAVQGTARDITERRAFDATRGDREKQVEPCAGATLVHSNGVVTVALQAVGRDRSDRRSAGRAQNHSNARALTDYEQLVARITALGQNLGNARELKTILRAVRDFTTASVLCDGMVISLYDEEKRVRKPVYCWVDNQEMEVNELSIPVGNGTTGRAITSGAIVIENDHQLHLDLAKTTALGDCTEDSSPRSALTAPMNIMGRTVGCIEIQSYQLDAYTQEDKTAMAMVASLAANAVENVVLMKREQEQLEQLRQSQKMEAVGQLAGGVAHDFNNLLTAISGYSDLGLRRLGDADPLRKNLEEIKKASTRATSLTRQLLAFSRKQMLQAKVLDLNAIVGDLDKMLRRLIGEDIDLVTSLDPISCQVKADPGQIEQVVLNLAVNARDAMPRGGKLTIETGHVYLDEAYARAHVAVQSGPYIMLAVSDTGAGMDPDVKKRVFEPFFTTKEVGKGTGLGLSTVYGIVKQSGGNIWVYSEPDQGSTFKIYLPLVHEKPEGSELKPNVEMPHGQETILLVEDEEMVRNLSREILEMNGYRVLTAANGEEACRTCEVFNGEIHLMVTDVVMPQMSGRELAESVAKKRPSTLVLYMSGYTDDAIVRHGVLDDGMPFLQKPFTPDSFARKVRELLEQPQAVAR